MMATRLSPLAIVAAALTLSACDTSGIDLASLDPTGKETTVNTTTVGITYAPGSMTTEQAQATVRDRCVEGEVVSITEPVAKEGGKLRISATCMATYNKRGELIPNGTT